MHRVTPSSSDVLRLNRRKLIGAGAAACGAALLGGCGLPTPVDRRPPLVGYLGLASAADPANVQLVEDFRSGLASEALIEDANVVIDWRWAEGRSHTWIREQVADLARRNASVIVASGSFWKPTREATDVVPIVMLGGNAEETVARGWATSVAQPEGTITGLSYQPRQASRKRIEVLTAVVPNLRHLAALSNLEQNARPASELREVGESFGLNVIVLDVAKLPDLESAFQRLRDWKADAIWAEGLTPPSRFAAPLARYALENRLPTIYSGSGPEHGGLMYYGTVFADGYQQRRGAWMVAQILRGVRVGEIPIEVADRTRLVVNRKTLAALGLTLPPHIAVQVTDWIE